MELHSSLSLQKDGTVLVVPDEPGYHNALHVGADRIFAADVEYSGMHTGSDQADVASKIHWNVMGALSEYAVACLLGLQDQWSGVGSPDCVDILPHHEVKTWARKHKIDGKWVPSAPHLVLREKDARAFVKCIERVYWLVTFPSTMPYEALVHGAALGSTVIRSGKAVCEFGQRKWMLPADRLIPPRTAYRLLRRRIMSEDEIDIELTA